MRGTCPIQERVSVIHGSDTHHAYRPTEVDVSGEQLLGGVAKNSENQTKTKLKPWTALLSVCFPFAFDLLSVCFWFAFPDGKANAVCFQN